MDLIFLHRKIIHYIIHYLFCIFCSDDDMPTLHRHGEVPAYEGEVPELPTEEEIPRIFVDIPRCTAHIGTDLHFVKLPNFLSVETRYP